MSLRGSLELRRLVTFGAVGAASTLIYAGLAWWLTAGLGVKPIVGSASAYLISGAFSYLANKRMTFRSDQPHRVEAPRFLASGLIGFAVATVLPVVLTSYLRLDAFIAIIVVCVAVPVLNFILLDKYVYAQRQPRIGMQATPLV